MEKIKVGYQGEIGSNSEAASIEMFKTNLENVELVPLVSSINVVESLKKREIDFGVMAFKNSIAGIVEETEDALKGIDFKIIESVDLPIRHSLFKRKDVDLMDIRFVASHEQALRQTAKTRKTKYYSIKEIAVDDTAKAARMLSNGELDKNYMVICKKSAGMLYGLELLEENVSDFEDNKTTFNIVKI